MQRENTLAAANGRAIRTYELGGVDTPATGLVEYFQWRFLVADGTSPVVNLNNQSPIEVMAIWYVSSGVTHDFVITASNVNENLLLPTQELFASDVVSKRETFLGMLLPEETRLTMAHAGAADAGVLVTARRVAATFVGLQQL